MQKTRLIFSSKVETFTSLKQNSMTYSPANISLEDTSQYDKQLSYEKENLVFSFTLSKQNKLTKLDGEVRGVLSLSCCLCASEFSQTIFDELEFCISNGVYSGDNPLVLYEAMDSIVSINDILTSETELLKNDYSTCEVCREKEEELSFDI